LDLTTLSGLVVTGFVSGLGSAVANYFVVGHPDQGDREDARER
jgi:hypothetical protein